MPAFNAAGERQCRTLFVRFARLAVSRQFPCLAVISLDNVITIPVALLGRRVGVLSEVQERQLAVATVMAFDLDIALRS